MAKNIIITESELRKIIKEEIIKHISEGIDINKTGNNRTVSVTNNHQNYVDTNDSHNPYLFLDTQRGFRTLSIFQRKSTNDRMDSNPLLNALKVRKGWKFNNAKSDLMKLLKNFVAASHLLPKYDTIVLTPSNNKLNEIVFSYLLRLIKHDYAENKFFSKLEAQDVYEKMINDDYINSHFENPSEVWNSIDDSFSAMNLPKSQNGNDGIFSYKFLEKSSYRDAILQSMKINIRPHSDLNYAEAINGKDVLVFDDTITTGKTISDSGKAIAEMFNPKSITFITLFSALDDANSTQQKVTSLDEKL